MTKKTNILTAAVIAAAAFAAIPSANAATNSGAAGISTAPAVSTALATLAVADGSGVNKAAGTATKVAHGRRWRHWHGFHGYYEPYYYGRGCRWMKRKWRRTGSRYWKRRYFRCINGWY